MNSNTKTFIVLGFIFAGIALLFCPPGFGIAGVVMGAIATARGNKTGIVVIVVSILTTIIGMAIGAAIGANILNQ